VDLLTINDFGVFDFIYSHQAAAWHVPNAG